MKTLWKNSNWWQKILIVIFIPLVLAGLGVYTYIKLANGIGDNKRFEKEIKANREKVNKEIKERINEIDKLENEMIVESAERTKIEKVIKRNEKEASSITERINNASANNDIDELKRIYKELRNKSKNIK